MTTKTKKYFLILSTVLSTIQFASHEVIVKDIFIEFNLSTSKKCFTFYQIDSLYPPYEFSETSIQEFLQNKQTKYVFFNLDMSQEETILVPTLLPKSLTTSSGALINNNTDKVTLTLKDQTLDLQEKLKKYFDNDLNNQNIIKAINYGKQINPIQKDPNQLKVVDEVKKATKSIEYNYPIFYLLQDSTISSVLTVKKGNNNQESILCGIAKDNKTEKEFVWVIDLKNDLSALLK